jgi:hypothetical protein
MFRSPASARSTIILALLASVCLAASGPLALAQSIRQVDVTSDSAVGWIPTVEQEDAARKAATDFLAALDNGDAKTAYALLNQGNQRLQPFAPFSRKLREFRAVAGAVKERRIVKVTWTKDPPSGPSPGIYVAIDLVSRFAKVDRHCGYLVVYQPSAGGPFLVMRREENYLSNANAATIAAQRSEAEVERMWTALSANCPNYPTAAVQKPPPLEEQRGSFEYPSVADALAALRVKPGVILSTENGWTIATDKKDFMIWSFTPAGNPAHPSVVKRHVVAKADGTTLEMEIRCEAAKEPCDDLVRAFQQLNESAISEARTR